MTNKAKEQAEERMAALAAKCRAEHSFPEKLQGWEFFKSINSPKYIVAPMVDQSELAWRILSRKYNADLCYTPMFNAKLFAKEEKYREEHWAGLQKGLGGGGPDDRPLIAQFCANDPEYLLQAALMVAPYCDAVDINLGCPQHIARRGHYGSFLMEDWPLIASLISTLHKHLPIPVTAKIRVFPEAEKTVAYAKMVVEAGAQVLVVHGRLREMKGHLTGVADWEKIKLVREAVGHLVPVIANGNILYHEDVTQCLEQTGCAGVMSAEGNLYNPAIFTPGHPESWKLAEEYLTICDEHDTKIAYTRGHLFKIFRPSLSIHTDLRSELGLANSREEMWAVTRKLKARLIEDAETLRQSGVSMEGEVDEQGFPKLPHWLAQPYFRQPMPDQSKQEKEKARDVAERTEADVALEGENSKEDSSVRPALNTKRTADDAAHREEEDDTTGLASSKDSIKAKKIKNKKAKIQATLCRGGTCNNSFSAKCVHQRCKGCCRLYQREQNSSDCAQHVIRSLMAQQQGLPRVDSEEAIGGVALEGMVNDTPPQETADAEYMADQKRKTNAEAADRCAIL
ncbi:tRNA-dihydrouridine(16/17) synthase [NAD(P)(+)]-like protein [Gryganskiella cystojenkinii]|nr:tRNA-dihydrouridine(16/17) synthase [NAD(P)(+)]-like protein [Gryganskiella cystojenkinii]